MKIWLLEEGERTGPHESYEVRDRIEAGDLAASTQAWYEGAPDWVRLDEVPVVEGLFRTRDSLESSGALATPISEEEVMEEQIALEYIYPPKLHLVRRFFARLFDLMLYMTLLIIVIRDPVILDPAQRDVMFHLMMGLGYVLIDAGMTNLWKCSPGKWLLGIRVVDSQGLAIGLGSSVMRSLRVWVLGWGMWIITPVSLAISWFMAKRLNYMVWDFPKRYRVVAEPLTAMRITLVVLAYLMLAVLMQYGFPPEVMEMLENQMQNPAP
ncbi:protein of unknown function [Rubritalea squalenifaciens DSM 18772]|uniref:RDD family protein n=1 Tax=Rubritalea squalenifaciens DSM 18772 TaxID=1123071 RepID=A0A1M6D639_9BACT|nr:RDD family protein [Rubritalea squalenifaciens]SHI68715.1 protein of unknown function [Rubritalea squalenifaciens DSM 18772]